MKYLKTTPYGKAKAKILLLSPLLVAYRTVPWRWVRPSLLAPHWLLLGCLLPPATLDLLETFWATAPSPLLGLIPTVMPYVTYRALLHIWSH